MSPRLIDITKIFKALAERNRLRTLHLLLNSETPLCVCELVDALGQSQYNVSRFLRELKQSGMIEEERRGKWVYYSVVDTEEQWMNGILAVVKKLEDSVFREDMLKLEKRLSLRESELCVVGLDSSEWKQLDG